jgi:hypothetical protein
MIADAHGKLLKSNSSTPGLAMDTADTFRRSLGRNRSVAMALNLG